MPNQRPPDNKPSLLDPRGRIFWWIVIVAAVFVVIFTLSKPPDYERGPTKQDFVSASEAGEIIKAQYRETKSPNMVDVWYKTKNGNEFVVTVPKEEFGSENTFAKAFAKEENMPVLKYQRSFFSRIFDYAWLFILIFIAILIFRSMRAQSASPMAFFGKSRARLYGGGPSRVTFADIAGVEEAKIELQELVDFLKFPERYHALGARIPKGALLVGPPGTGKTLLARAVAGEAGVPFFSISGSEFVEMFVGVGAARVRDLFEQAKQNAPCIVFVDEIDAVGRQRGAGLGGGNDEREQTLNQILAEMDGFETGTHVVVIAATNRPDVLDPALLRPGRFDRRIIVDDADMKGRKEILKIHMRGKPFTKDGTKQTSEEELEELAEYIARQSPGFSGADLASAVNEAAILAARAQRRFITLEDLTEGLDRAMAGPERKSKVLSPKEKELVAYHEAGHALVAYVLPHTDPPGKISIVSRGLSGGYTKFMPEEEHVFHTKSELEEMTAVAYGGYAAEQLFLAGDSTQGPSHDLERLAQLIKQMVLQYGMGEGLLPQAYGTRQGPIFLAKELHEQDDVSEKKKQQIEDAKDTIMRRALHTAKKVLQENRVTLEKLVNALKEKEVLEQEEIAHVLAQARKVTRDDVAALYAEADAAGQK